MTAPRRITLALGRRDDTPEAERAGLTTIHQSRRDHGRLFWVVYRYTGKRGRVSP